ncbi:hypothetical protein HYPSUDRAFT_902641 [Hypholoma sublateritium FD-334 SS-4]|uniref:F-box domain-containing protein n=1 Tax=Hypholoma sublateritium (strain FD-334 SS-4) TaxID=945553 RepID=A0A0D2KWX3_HYPSF|nr:hypothetical protein HYPSUDRAFT_902641 [Hypholoma sublateritium FD-334 SS-4]
MPDELTQREFEHLQNLQREREQLSEKLSQIDGEISRLTLEYGQAHNSQTPIFSLPNEVLLLIFEYAYYTCRFEVRDIRNDEEDLGWDHCDDDRDITRTICNNCRTIEMDLSHVCHLWRVLAHGYSELWSTFNYRCRQWGYRELRLPMYLARSRERPLDIWLDIYKQHYPQISMIMSILLPHAARWRRFSVRLEGGDADPSVFFRSIGPFDAKNLETFEITLYCDNLPNTDCTVQWPGHPGRIFKNRRAPKLTSMRVDLAFSNLCWPAVSNLTVLQFDSSSNARFARAITRRSFCAILQLPNLASLTLADYILTSNQAGPMPVIVAPNLRHLRCMDNEILTYIWGILKAPVLELLVLKGANISHWLFPPEDSSDSPGLPYLPSLRTLCFLNCEAFDEPHSAQIFSRFAHATRSAINVMFHVSAYSARFMDLREPGILPTSKNIFACLLESNNVIYWPNLKTLACSGKSVLTKDIETTQLVAMLLKREQELRLSCTVELCVGERYEEYMDNWRRPNALGGGRRATLWMALQEEIFHRVIVLPQYLERWSSVWTDKVHAEFHRSSEWDFRLE